MPKPEELTHVDVGRVLYAKRYNDVASTLRFDNGMEVTVTDESLRQMMPTCGRPASGLGRGLPFADDPAVQACLTIAESAHMGQTDRGGNRYVYHPVHVARRMDTVEEACAALLHDVLEDTPMTAAKLRCSLTLRGVRGRMCERVVDAVVALTREDDEPYQDYMARVSRDPIAVKVKVEDLRHNLDASRLKSIGPKDLERMQGYLHWLRLLEDMAAEGR